MERRLAAILAADVAGYTALMGADEEGTLRRLTDLRQGLLELTRAAAANCPPWWPTSETAMAGYPRKRPSIAAATVPE